MAEKQTLMIENARIIFRNFEGKEGPYNRKGDRNFAILLDDELAEQLHRDGWNVKLLKPREEGDPEQPFLSVAVSFKTRSPRMVLITHKGRTPLTEEECEILDWIDIKTVDVTLNPYEWQVNGKSGIKAYLKTIFVIMEEDPLEMKYSSIPEIGSTQVQQALPAGESHVVIDGEFSE